MVAQKKAQAPVTIVESPAPAMRLEVDDLAALKLQQKALSERIKQLRADQPKRTRLEQVIHLQTVQHDMSVDRKIANRVRARVRAGQDRIEAMNQVVEFYRNLADERLDMDDLPETDRTEEEEEVK